MKNIKSRKEKVKIYFKLIMWICEAPVLIENNYDITIPNKKYIIKNEIIKIIKLPFLIKSLMKYLKDGKWNKRIGKINIFNIFIIKLPLRIYVGWLKKGSLISEMNFVIPIDKYIDTINIKITISPL